MGKSCPESILLIHRELLSDGKGLIRPVLYGISRGFAIRKEKGKIKGEKYRMMKGLDRPFLWREIGQSFNYSNLRKADCL
jgi:hypothetical protein